MAPPPTRRPAISIRRGPARSTRKPAGVCSSAEQMLNTVRASATCVKLTPNASFTCSWIGGSSMMWTWLVKWAIATRAITLASRLMPAPAGRSMRSLVDDIDAQGSYARDLDLELVAGLHPERRLAPGADAVGRAGGDDVARLQRGHGREIFDDGRDIEDHVIGRVVLHHLTVQPRRELQPLRVLHDVGGDQPRAERPGGREVLAGGRGVLLEVAHAAVDETGIACHHGERAGARHMAATLADHHGELALEIEGDRGARPHHAAARRHQRVAEAREDAGCGRQLAAHFTDVAGIVEADAEDLRRIGDDRQQLDVV